MNRIQVLPLAIEYILKQCCNALWTPYTNIMLNICQHHPHEGHKKR